MKESYRYIFRPEVVQRFIREREKAVLPRFITTVFFQIVSEVSREIGDNNGGDP